MESSGGIGFGGGEEPGEIRPIELDRGKVVRLEVGHMRLRLGPDDLARIDAGDVARAVELDVDVDGCGAVDPQADRKHQMSAC